MSSDDLHRVECHLGEILDRLDMTLVELSEADDVTVANLSILKNDRARAIRFSKLTAICDALDVQPGDVLTVAAK
jgi:putative transcriptional regulator